MDVSTTTSDSNKLLYPIGLSGHENALQPKRCKQLDPSKDYPPAPSDLQKLGKRPSGTRGIGRFILCCNQGKKILVTEIVKFDILKAI